MSIRYSASKKVDDISRHPSKHNPDPRMNPKLEPSHKHDHDSRLEPEPSPADGARHQTRSIRIANIVL